MASELVALNVKPFYETQNEVAQSDYNQSRARVARATEGDDIAKSGLDVEAKRMSNEESGLALTLKRQGTYETMMADALSQATDSESWSQAIGDQIAQGNPLAQQWKDRAYSPERQQQAVRSYAAKDAIAAMEARQAGYGDTATDSSGLGIAGGGHGGRGASGLAAQGSAGPGYDPYAAAFEGKSPEQLAQTYHNLAQAKAALDHVAQSDNPAAAWAQLAPQFGVDPTFSAQSLQQGYAEVLPALQALQAHVMQGKLGIPQPKAAPKVEAVGGALYAINPDGTVKPLTEAAGSYQPYIDAEGNTVSYNTKTGETTALDRKLTGRVGGGAGGGGSSVYSQKYQDWLADHPGDTKGAFQHAAGEVGRALSGDVASLRAYSQAEREYNDRAFNNNAPEGDPSVWVDRRAQQLYDQAKASGAGTAGGKPPAPTFTQAQRQYEAQHPENKQAQQGTAERPWYVKSPDELKKFPPGTYFVGPSGILRHKPK